MHFEHTPERDSFIAARGKVVLNACPGSGKTTTIAYKIHELLKRWAEMGNHRFQGIACLSFTNVAKDEIITKCLEFRGSAICFPHLVSTIDSFVNQLITLPFFSIIYPRFGRRPVVLEDSSFLDSWTFPASFGQIPYSYKPSSIEVNLDGTFCSAGKKPRLLGDDLASFTEYCRTLKRRQFENGLLSNSDSTYAALKILRKCPSIAKMLANRFSHIIIDEAQDTSEIQHAIFDELIINGLKSIELVGDPYQSLYEWREARPDLFVCRCESGDWTSLKLTECRRSSQTIVDAYSKLRNSSEPNLKSIVTSTSADPVEVIMFDEEDYPALLEKYESLAAKYENRIVVVRGTTHLKKLGATTETPDLWKISPSVPKSLIQAYFELQSGKVKHSVERIRRFLPTLIDPHAANYGPRYREILQELVHDVAWTVRIMDTIGRLPSLDHNVHQWTAETQLLCKEGLRLDSIPDFGLKGGTYRKYHSQQVGDLFAPAVNFEKVTTIHKVKGKTFDSLMLVLAATSAGASISLKDISRPSRLPSEKGRLIYVAMSRPRFQLAVAVPKETSSVSDIMAILGESVNIHRL